MEKAEIVWAAPSNSWPKELWTYKVVPQQFSPGVVSNLLAMSGFSLKDRTNMLDQSPFKDKTILFFRNADQSKHLGIFPALGYIDYNDRYAKASSQLQPVVNVPTPEEATRLGLKYLKLLGIDVSQVATKPGSSDLALHWERETIEYRDQTNQSWVKLTNMCGVFFLRCVDGINFNGIGLHGGMEISFGNNSKIVDLHICWRNLKRSECHSCVSQNQVVGWIKSGQIRLPAEAGPLEQIKKLTITRAIPLYQGNLGEEKQDMVVPYLYLQAVVDNGSKSKNVSLTSILFEPPLEKK